MLTLDRDETSTQHQFRTLDARMLENIPGDAWLPILAALRMRYAASHLFAFRDLLSRSDTFTHSFDALQRCSAAPLVRASFSRHDVAPVADKPEQWLASQIGAIRGFATLGADWNSYGAEPVNPMSIESAIRFLRSLESRYGEIFGEKLKPVIVAPLPSGGLQLEWEGKDRRIELEIWANGETSVLEIVGTTSISYVFTSAANVADAMRSVAGTLMA